MVRAKQQCEWPIGVVISPTAGNADVLCNRPARRVPYARYCAEHWAKMGRPKKVCPQCNVEYPADTIRRVCRACQSANAHANRIEQTFGITGEDYARLLEAQNGRCAICGNRPRKLRLAVDHNHATGEVRGLLCKRCNKNLLGGAHDATDLLRAAINYLEDPPARRVLR